MYIFYGIYHNIKMVSSTLKHTLKIALLYLIQVHNYKLSTSCVVLSNNE